MEYLVRYVDSTGCNSIATYHSEDAAESAIAEELEEVKEYFRCRNYDYGEFADDDGFITKIWSCDDNEYASWTRLWL